MIMRRNTLSPAWTLPVAVLLYMMLVVSLNGASAAAASLEEIWNFSAPALRDPFLDRKFPMDAIGFVTIHAKEEHYLRTFLSCFLLNRQRTDYESTLSTT